MGDQLTFTAISGTPNSSTSLGWQEFSNNIFILPDGTHEINEDGCEASHEYQENTDQSRNRPSVHWRKNITMPVNMSDYEIISASLTTLVNATGDTNLETPFDDLQYNAPTIGSASFYDYAKFYVEISDIDFENSYEVASNQTVSLGIGDQTLQGTGVFSYMPDTNLTNDDESDLIFYLNQAFNVNPSNFTITLGIDIFCEDNYDSADRDNFYSLLIKSCNLSLTVRKKIDKLTSISWNQDGEKISSLSPENYNVVATDANLKFQYKIDKNWTIYTSDQNSEINIYLNGNPYLIPIKLTNVNGTFQEAIIELSPPSESVNLSIEVLLRETFNLNQSISISLDNVTLDISYTIFIPDISSGGGGGGGKTIIRGTDNTPIVIGLTIGIIALISFFGAYQKHFKYPPTVRKIRKLRKKIKKGRKLKPVLVSKRDSIVKNRIGNNIKIVESETISPKIEDKIKK